ncbi:hydrogenase large subunit [Halapricum hydrolyticum]|uniref:Nickel-dependent hydrogenase large subunit n=1 Tax=Halapricum hydrolyticum TaxID=2979991 RepID=A0AAE3LH82_9EURY|nr:nickel-dependent hydrogenase large subunit [Halapricum hydrolyticum]MCU4717495.1 nickel-dependent hydrogenase large subunit [Halapricum hydrolyticum]MCU4726659.1 nickel-dependent hydrogenase large subunit [Halapricum hydrolyticum]
MAEETTIPIGPQHPSLKEPANFELTVEGEQITGAELSISYNHRGIEQAVRSKSYLENIYLLERICGICSHSHTTAFVRGVEQLLGLSVPDRARYVRTLVAELERLHSHLLWLGVAGHEIGFDTLWQYAWRDREAVMDSLEELTGNRVHYSINTIGGVREDIDTETIDAIRDRMAELSDRIDFYLETVPAERTVQLRCEDVGVVSKQRAQELCAVGPTARASGVQGDVRKDEPYAAYDEVDFEVITAEDGDLLARLQVRIEELAESVAIIEQVLADLPEGELKASQKPPQALLAGIESGDVLSRYEAPRGELTHFIRSDGSDTPERVHVRVPTLANWPTVVEALKGSYIADTPIVVAGIDPCISCTSRIGVAVAEDEATLADATDSGVVGVDESGTDDDPGGYTLDDLREYGIEWYEGGDTR